MDKHAKIYAHSVPRGMPSLNWLTCCASGASHSALCEPAARALGERARLAPILAPTVIIMLLLLGDTNANQPVVAFLTLYTLLFVATAVRVLQAFRLANVGAEGILANAKRYCDASNVAALAWSALAALWLYSAGPDTDPEWAWLATLAIALLNLRMLSLEISQWTRFNLALWLPLVGVSIGTLWQQTLPDWLMFAFALGCAWAVWSQGRRWVEEHLQGLQWQLELSASQKRCVQQHEQLASQREELGDVQARVHQMAHFDQLTRLASRQHFQDRLSQAVRFSGTRRRGFALLYVDLDDFKDINDTFGHAAGDQVMLEVAQRLRALLGKHDFAARLGSDEFALLIDKTEDGDALATLAQNCLNEIKQPISLRDAVISPKASIGIAVYPQDGDDASDLLKAAESAMHASKASGSHKFAQYVPAMTRASAQRLTMEQELSKALAEEQFELHYQAQQSAIGGGQCGAEALLRWRHPEKGLLLPQHFIDTIERTGMIVAVGDWVLREACTQAAQWIDEGVDDFQIAVNISPLQLHDERFVTRLAEILEETGLPAHALELEITESALQTDSRIQRTMSLVQELGVHFAIDDFGTGYSSLASLQKLPIDRVKIDRSFVSELLSSTQNRALLRSIIELAHLLGCEVVAEGVETAEQEEQLRGMNCDCLQGFYFARPIADFRPQKLLDSEAGFSSCSIQ